MDSSPKNFNYVIYSASKKNYMKVNGYRQLFGFKHSSKNLLLCSKKEMGLEQLSVLGCEHFIPFK